MKISLFLRRQLVWLNLPSALLITLLQRAPVLNLGSTAGSLGGAAPLGAMLRSAVAGAAALGGMVTIAGATELSASSPSPYKTTVGTSLTIAFSITGTTSGADNWFVGGAPPGTSFSGTSSETLILSGTPTTAGTYNMSITGNDAIGGSTPAYSYQVIVEGNTPVNVPPALTAQPASNAVDAGGNITFNATATGSPAPTYQWMRNGRPIGGATSASYTKNNVQPGDAGIYSVVATNAAGSVTSDQAILGVGTTELFVGNGFSDPEWRSIQHQNGNSYTQILLTGPSATVTADPGKVTRISYIDLQDDIVQLEFSGAGTMTVTLDNPSGPALPTKYNQGVEYMRGHASVIIQGAGANTFFSAFSVGSATAVNQALFKGDVTYDGHADLARLVIQSPTSEFGGLFMGNTGFNDTAGFTGIFAPGIMTHNNIRLNDISAFDSAQPVLIFLATMNAEDGLRVNGGDLEQPNSKSVELRGVNKVIMGAGTDSHGRFEVAKANRARFVNAGTDVTNSVVVNP